MDLVARYYPEKNFLKKVRDFCSKNKILLVFDEIVTGFRINKGGLKLFLKLHQICRVLEKQWVMVCQFPH